MSYLLSDYSYLDQHQSSLDPWYLEFSSFLNHGQTKTAKGSNRILLFNNNKNTRQKRYSQGHNRDSQGQNRDKLGQKRDDQGQNRDSQGQNRGRGIIGQTPMVDLPNTNVDLPDTMEDLPETMVDLPDIMVNRPYTMVKNLFEFHPKSFKIKCDGLYIRYNPIFLYLPNGSCTTRSPGLVLNQTLNGFPGHGLSDLRIV